MGDGMICAPVFAANMPRAAPLQADVAGCFNFACRDFLVRGTSRQNWTVRNKLGWMGKLGKTKKWSFEIYLTTHDDN